MHQTFKIIANNLFHNNNLIVVFHDEIILFRCHSSFNASFSKRRCPCIADNERCPSAAAKCRLLKIAMGAWRLDELTLNYFSG